MGMYTVLSMLFLFLVRREIEHGPEPAIAAFETTDRWQPADPWRCDNHANIWFMIVAVMLAAYVVLDGFDLGAGAIHLFVGRTDDERRTVLRAIGPVWDGNEVWLLAAGGTLYFAFPLLYASSFSGFYLPLMMVLWLLMLRAIGIEFRTHIARAQCGGLLRRRLLRSSSVLLAIFFGAALGNVVRGVPLDADGYFFEPLWTNWRVGANPAFSTGTPYFRRAGAGGAHRARRSVCDVEDRGATERTGSQDREPALAGAWIAHRAEPDRNDRNSSDSVDELQGTSVGYLIPLVVFGSLIALFFYHSKGSENLHSSARACIWRACSAGRRLRCIRTC